MNAIKRVRPVALLMAFLMSAHSWGGVPFGDYTKDVESIKKMTGCYKVTFQNAETFSLSKDYQYHDRYKSGHVLECIIVDS